MTGNTYPRVLSYFVLKNPMESEVIYYLCDLSS